MYLSSEDESKLGGLVKSLVGDKVSILAYDHNWDHPEYPLDILKTQETNGQLNFVGTAWHCYGGDMKIALSTLQSSYPTMEQHITECTGSFPDAVCNINRGMEGFGWNHEWDMQNLFLGPVSLGSKSTTKWIFALDENCGPTLPLVTYTFGRPFVSVPSWATSIDDIKFNQDYWTTRHFSQFVKPGFQRISTSVDHFNNENVIIESFTDGSNETITTIVMNLDHENDMAIHFSEGQTSFTITLKKFTTMVLQWK